MVAPTLVTLTDAALALGVSEKTVHEWAAAGWLVRRYANDPRTHRRRTVFDRAAVEALAAERAAGILREVPPTRRKSAS